MSHTPQKEMQPHQLRVIKERDELVEKRDKLLEFIRSGALFTSLPHAERMDMVEQVDVMMLYASILTRRIHRFFN